MGNCDSITNRSKKISRIVSLDDISGKPLIIQVHFYQKSLHILKETIQILPIPKRIIL